MNICPDFGALLTFVLVTAVLTMLISGITWLNWLIVLGDQL